MNLVERITEESRHLPLQAQSEALDFIVFLRSRYQRSAAPENEDDVSRLLPSPLQETDPLSRQQAADDEWQNLMFSQVNSLMDWDNEEDEVWNDVPAV
jgi:hypothetical protein